MRLLLPIASIHEFPSRSIYFGLSIPRYDLDVDVFVDLPLGMEVDGNIVDFFLKLNKSIYVLNQASANWFDILKTGLERRVTINVKLTLEYFTEKTQLS